MNNKDVGATAKLVLSVYITTNPDGSYEYNMSYCHNEDMKDGTSVVASAIFRLMQDFPDLMEQICYSANKALKDTIKPFNDILNEKRL